MKILSNIQLDQQLNITQNLHVAIPVTQNLNQFLNINQFLDVVNSVNIFQQLDIVQDFEITVQDKIRIYPIIQDFLNINQTITLTHIPPIIPLQTINQILIINNNNGTYPKLVNYNQTVYIPELIGEVKRGSHTPVRGTNC